MAFVNQAIHKYSPSGDFRHLQGKIAAWISLAYAITHRSHLKETNLTNKLVQKRGSFMTHITQTETNLDFLSLCLLRGSERLSSSFDFS